MPNNINSAMKSAIVNKRTVKHNFGKLTRDML